MELLLAALALSVAASIWLYVKFLQKSKEFGSSLKMMEESLTKTHIELATERSKPKGTTFGVITKYSEEDLDLLSKDTEALNCVIKILTYHTVMKSDALRNPENQSDVNRLMKCVGESNSMHELLLFFYKLSQKPE